MVSPKPLAGTATTAKPKVPVAAGRGNGPTLSTGAPSSWTMLEPALTTATALLGAPVCIVKLRKVSLRSTLRRPLLTATSVTVKLNSVCASVLS